MTLLFEKTSFSILDNWCTEFLVKLQIVSFRNFIGELAFWYLSLLLFIALSKLGDSFSSVKFSSNSTTLMLNGNFQSLVHRKNFWVIKNLYQKLILVRLKFLVLKYHFEESERILDSKVDEAFHRKSLFQARCNVLANVIFVQM